MTFAIAIVGGVALLVLFLGLFFIIEEIDDTGRMMAGLFVGIAFWLVVALFILALVK